MNNGRKRKGEKTPLFVKEIIFPEKKATEPNQTYLDRNSTISVVNLKSETSELGFNSVEIGNHNVKSVKELLILEKKPLENYFTGTKAKKHGKKKKGKLKPPESTPNFKELYCEESLMGLNGKMQNEQFLKEKDSFTKEEKIQIKVLQLRLQRCKKMQDYAKQNNYMSQRLIEKKYIQQQENLAETWWAFLQRRNQLKQFNLGDGCSSRKPIYTDYCNNYNKTSFSILSRKFWNDDRTDDFLEKPEKCERQDGEKKFQSASYKSKLADLEKRFPESLVFIDDEDKD